MCVMVCGHFVVNAMDARRVWPSPPSFEELFLVINMDSKVCLVSSGLSHSIPLDSTT